MGSLGRKLQRNKQGPNRAKVWNDMLQCLKVTLLFVDRKEELRKAVETDFKPTELKMLRTLIAQGYADDAE